MELGDVEGVEISEEPPPPPPESANRGGLLNPSSWLRFVANASPAPMIGISSPIAARTSVTQFSATARHADTNASELAGAHDRTPASTGD